MKFDEHYINQLLHAYKKLPSEALHHQLQELLIPYSGEWIRRFYHVDEDCRQEFIVYILGFFEQILNSYPDSKKVYSQSWINAVLYNKFCDFVKTKDLTQPTVLTSNIDQYCFLESELISLNWYNIIEQLSPDEKGMWMFYNAPQYLDASLLVEVAQYLNKPLHEIICIYDEVLQVYYETRELQESFYQKIKKIDNKIAHLQNIISKKNENIDELECQLQRFKYRQRKYIRSLKPIPKKLFKIFVKLFNNYDSAYRISKKIELRIKKILMQDKIDL